MQNPFNILIAGVGGQGNVTSGKILATAAQREGLRPVIGETFGASRRGGTVYTHVRIGDTDLGPLIPVGRLHVLLGLEPMETLRASLEFAGRNTIVIMSSVSIPPIGVHARTDEYPPVESIISSLEKMCARVHTVDSDSILRPINAIRSLNILLIGIMAGLGISPLGIESLRLAMLDILGPSDKNLQAFELGLSDNTG
ncbi:MAG: Indolepyruvate oxidoreductase subunit IorB [Candidatus Thorarchaeota archaeon]|nr:MAG: Indolepyruvate oxidoreductase subunit IorB [Candidatus Thorarchaeota archaeon]